MKSLAAWLLLASLAIAKHGGTADFDALTSKWYQVSQTPVPNQKIRFSWSDDSTTFFYETEQNGTKSNHALDIATGETRDSDVGITPNGKTWATQPAPPPHTAWESPDGKFLITLEGCDVLRCDGSSPVTIGAAEHGHHFEGPPIWSPDGSAFLLWHKSEVPLRKVHYVRSSPKDQLQPRHFTRTYPKPGDVLPASTPWVFPIGGKPIPADSALAPHAYEFRNPSWSADGKRLTYQAIERGFGYHRVLEIDTTTRRQRVVIDESSDTFLNVFGYGFRHDLSDGNRILWTSERDGWNHLYLIDATTGKTIRQLTQGDWLIKRVQSIDEANHRALLKICGYYPGQDPYFEHYALLDYETAKLTLLTSSPGTHSEPVFSPDGGSYVCTWSRIDHPPVHELRRTADGSLIATLATADASELLAKWPAPEPFVAKDRNGKFDIYGIIIRPPGFDPAKSYPVIENIYAGPQDAFTPKAWRPWLSSKHELAVHGFIVVQLDGLGTAHRGRAFHNICYKNLKDAGLPDRIAWLKAAAQKYPQLDLSRVGIYGGSAGGQSALGALLFHGDFYKAAVADCGCHDNRIDKLWWNEQWMDWPVGPEYAENSNVTHAANLTGALMLTVGECDTNVDPSSTLQVVNALIKADKDFDLIVVPNGEHGIGESRHLQRKRADFFLKHLAE